MSSKPPTLVFVPGSWHRPSCYEKIIEPLQKEHGTKCVSVTLPSTQDDPNATFKDDIDAARSAIISETEAGNDVIVIAHSYGGMVGNSAIKGLTSPMTSTSTSPSSNGCVKALVLIASGFTITGLSFMAPLFNIPPPSWRVDKASGYAVLVTDPRDLFYHDLDPKDAEYWTTQLTTQSLKALFEGGEYAYAGWQDVPVWYIGTVEDRGLPVIVQRVQVGMARGQGATVYHTELRTGHSPFLSMPGEVVRILLDAVYAVSGLQRVVDESVAESSKVLKIGDVEVPSVRLLDPATWFKFGLPFVLGRVVSWGFVGFMKLRRLWKRWR